MELWQLYLFLRNEWEVENELKPFKFPVKTITNNELPNYKKLYNISGSTKN